MSEASGLFVPQAVFATNFTSYIQPNMNYAFRVWCGSGYVAAWRETNWRSSYSGSWLAQMKVRPAMRSRIITPPPYSRTYQAFSGLVRESATNWMVPGSAWKRTWSFFLFLRRIGSEEALPVVSDGIV